MAVNKSFEAGIISQNICRFVNFNMQYKYGYAVSWCDICPLNLIQDFMIMNCLLHLNISNSTCSFMHMELEVMFKRQISSAVFLLFQKMRYKKRIKVLTSQVNEARQETSIQMFELRDEINRLTEENHHLNGSIKHYFTIDTLEIFPV
jgi:hypothetical protein